MQSFLSMKIGMFLALVVGRAFHAGIVRHDEEARKRVEAGRVYREGDWHVETGSDATDSMFRVLGPITSAGSSARQPSLNPCASAGVNLTPRTVQKAKPAAIPTMQTQPAKTMRVFFDDTAEG